MGDYLGNLNSDFFQYKLLEDTCDWQVRWSIWPSLSGQLLANDAWLCGSQSCPGRELSQARSVRLVIRENYSLSDWQDPGEENREDKEATSVGSRAGERAIPMPGTLVLFHVEGSRRIKVGKRSL